MYICVDFDGTCVTHEFPYVGKEIGAAPVLRYLARDHKLILYTMRGDASSSGNRQFTFLEDAVKWFKKHDIPLYGVNENPGASFSNSPKVHADLYIDDRALGIPLDSDKSVDWIACVKILHNQGLIDSLDVNNLITQVKYDKYATH